MDIVAKLIVDTGYYIKVYFGKLQKNKNKYIWRIIKREFTKNYICTIDISGRHVGTTVEFFEEDLDASHVLGYGSNDSYLW